MKIEQIVIGGGLAVVIGLSVVAIFADDLWEDEYHDAPAIPAGILSPHRDGREKISCNSCHVILVENTNNTEPEERRAEKGAERPNAGAAQLIAFGGVAPVSH